MTKEVDRREWGTKRGGGDAVYGLGFVGTLVYYMGHAHGFVPVLTGIGKSLVWPAILAYQVLNHFH